MDLFCSECGHEMMATQITQVDKLGRYLELRECPNCNSAWMWAWWEHQERWERMYRERFSDGHELGGMSLLERLEFLRQNMPERPQVYRQLSLPLQYV